MSARVTGASSRSVIGKLNHDGSECVLALDVFGHPLETPARHGVLARIHQRDAPRLGMTPMHPHFVVGHVEGHVRHVQEVVREVFLDQVALVAATDDEIVDAVRGVDLHHMPEDRPAADLDHVLGLEVRFLGNARAEAAGEDDGFHDVCRPRGRKYSMVFRSPSTS